LPFGGLSGTHLNAQTMIAAPDPHPALRATFSRKREKGFCSRADDALDALPFVTAVADRGYTAPADEGRGAPPLPLAGEGWGEGEPPPMQSGAAGLPRRKSP